MSHEHPSPPLTRVALLGNFLPRHCGIATFTTHLAGALSEPSLGLTYGVVAMNDAGKRYAYDQRVLFEIAQGNISSYSRAAEFLNVGGFDVLCVQHEYGIFGGRAGAHILTLLSQIRLPIVTTLHTILASPSLDQRRVMNGILRLSTRVVVMSNAGASLLTEGYDARSTKIDVIPHGIPVLPDRDASRARLRVGDKIQLLTFGLLSPDKGIEYVIDALPAVLERFPKVEYVIVGATHPQVKDAHGEAYRSSLQLRAHKLGVARHIVFHDRFVSDAELAEFLSAADVYLTPYLNPQQITSGTLAYAVGTGKAVISTPYRHAQELLRDGSGILVPSRNSEAIAQALIQVLSEPGAQARKRQADIGKDMLWSAVAAAYKVSFGKAQVEYASDRAARASARPSPVPRVELPELNLAHIKLLTDDTGLLQHAHFSVPRYEDGYCIDDNARALLLVTLLEESGTDDVANARALSSRYLAFMAYAFNKKTQRFRNFMSYSRDWSEEWGSEDSQGRALWSLGTVVGRTHVSSTRALATQLFRAALPGAGTFTSPRAVAFSLLGVDEYLKAFSGDCEAERTQRSLASSLLSRFAWDFGPTWAWCEESLAYDNARIPQALLVSGRSLGDAEITRCGLHALDWLVAVQTSRSGIFSPVGSNGFYERGGTKAQFDQQPLEACATVAACLEAWRDTRNDSWIRHMWQAFSWFLGENEGNASLYDPLTHGCRDGLHPDRVNENQGAESTLSFLLSLVDMRVLSVELRLEPEASGDASAQAATGPVQ